MIQNKDLPKNLIKWADIIIVMDEAYKQLLFTQCHNLQKSKRFFVLDIPDQYSFMQAELIDKLEAKVSELMCYES